MRVYLNGDGVGRSTHVSLFLVVMRGPYDALLAWPFNHRVSMSIPAQRSAGRPVTDSFRADPSCSSFQRPTGEMNVAAGFPRFMAMTELENMDFVRDDTMFVSVSVDMTTFRPPTTT